MRISAPFISFWVAPALLIMAGSLCAAQTPALSGNWHINVSKSKWGSTTKPVSVVVVIDHRDPEIHYHGAVTYANEDTREFGFTGAFDGKPYRMSRSFGEGMITLRRLDALTFESTFRTDDGQYTEEARTMLSRDGRTLTRKLTVRSPEGVRSWTELYEKR